jgi:hypothetical protein
MVPTGLTPAFWRSVERFTTLVSNVMVVRPSPSVPLATRVSLARVGVAGFQMAIRSPFWSGADIALTCALKTSPTVWSCDIGAMA